MTYSFFDNITAINYRVIQTSLAKIKIPVLEFARDLTVGDSISGNSGESISEFFLESVIFAAQSGGYHRPIRHYTPNDFWYVDNTTFIEVLSDTDSSVRYRLHSDYGDRDAGINWDGTNARIVQVCPIFYLLHTGNNYLVGFSYFFDQSKGIIVTDPVTDRIGYMTYAGILKSGVSSLGGTFNNIQQRDFDFGNYIYNESEPVSTDPYNPGGESDTGGGTGTFDGTGDDINIPSLPTLSATDTGFITLFNPSAGELRSLANYMWSNPLFDLDAWKKIFADPMDAILGLSIVPVAVPNGGSSTVTVGNISTGISMNKAGAQYVSVDCGTLNIVEYWGGYLDYDPYTKAEIYLPYIGTHPLSVDDIMGKSVHVVYHVDILSGACCAYVKCGGSVIYSFVGQCSCSIPITGNDWTNVVNGALSIAASIGTMVATGGATAPMAAASLASSAVNSMKPNVEKSGSMGGMGGMLGVQVPYLILTRPRQALPAYQNRYMGYPSFITRDLSDLSGYTEIEEIHLENVPATEQELLEIVTLLKEGVIL